MIIGIWMTCLIALVTDGFTRNPFAEDLAQMGPSEFVLFVLAMLVLCWLSNVFMESYWKMKNPFPGA